MRFKDELHEEYFRKFIKDAEVPMYDRERVSLFYIFSLIDETRKHINTLYDFNERCIKLSGLNEPWQTGGTTKATKLAFNLYNGYRGEDRENEDFSPLTVFSISDEYRDYLLMAVQIRFK